MTKHTSETQNDADDTGLDGHASAFAATLEIGEAQSPAEPVASLGMLRRDPTAIRRLFESGEYPYKTAMRTKAYEAHMLELQRELLKAQRWVE
jgi:hypothetical protein